MEDELTSVDKNYTWSVVNLSARNKAKHNKWVFHVMYEIDGSKTYKERLVFSDSIRRKELITMILSLQL